MRHLCALLLLLPALAGATQTTPDDTVAALWRALSHPPGASADVAALKALFHPEAVVFGVHYKDGVAALRRTGIADFLVAQQRVSGKGFYECEVARDVKVYDRHAAVHSVVESRSDKAAAEPLLVGVNNIQLYRSGEEWQILSLYYQVEKQGVPIPPGAGTKGKCLDAGA